MLVALALLVGCSGGLTGDGPGDAGGDGGDGDGAVASGGDGDGGRAEGDDSGVSDGGSDGTAADRAAYALQQCAVIRTGSVRLRIGEFDAARDRIVGIAEQRGGFVASSDESKVRSGERTWTEGTVTVRVPSDEFAAAFREIKGIETVVRSSSSAGRSS